MCFTLIAYSQTIPFLNSNQFKWFNFECGGFVTAVYPAFNNSGLSNQILYAKTDVGGVYRSSNNGLNWNLISSYYEGTSEQNANLFFSEYIIAGMAVHPTDPNQLIISWGNNKNDASNSDNYKCLWRTTNGGINWVKPVFKDNNGNDIQGPWFQGDVFERKLGGECIIYDPRPGQSFRVFVGGISPNGAPPKLFMSSNSGVTFYPVFDNFNSGDTITCIAMHKNRNEVFVGTSSGIYKSEGFNDYNPKPFQKLPIPQSTIRGKFVRRILMKPDLNGKVFFVFGKDTTDFYVKGGGIARYDSLASSQNVWKDLTGNFGTENAYTGNYFSLLTWADTSGSVLLAGRIYNPVKKSINDGENWNGEGGTQIKFRYNPVDFPEHQPLHEMNDFIYSGLNFILKNPYYNCWYMGGGAGVRIGTENSQPLDNDIFSNVTWKYSTNGQSMPVVYDIAFEPLPNNWNPDVFFPISDWTMAYKNNQISDFTKLKYDYRRTGGSTANTWISNVSRLLISTDSTRVTYAIGGDLYYNKFAKMYRRYMVNDDSCNIKQIQSHFLFNTPNRFISDGVIFDHGTFRNRLLILVGSTEQDTFPNFNTGLGLYFSTNKGESFNYCYFGQQSQAPGINTLDQYHSSKLPSVGYNGTIGGMFDSQFNLVTVPISHNNTLIYLYLQGGGLFVSKNGGEGWAATSAPLIPDSCNKGSLKYVGNSTLALAIDGKGLYKGVIDINSGFVTWEPFGNFTSASQVDVYNGKWVVFGQRDNINIDRLFKYTNWPTPNWRLITGRIRGVRSLRIRPNNTNEVWIATTGMGVVVYNQLLNLNFLISKEASVCDNVNINTNTTFDEDVVVENGGQLILQDSAVIQLAEGVKIIVQEGGKLQANNVTFISKSENENWGGIEVENCDSSLTIQNCTFNNASLPIKIINNETSAFNEKIIKNNVFNCQNSSDFAIYAENVFNILIQGNQFNMSGESSSTVGLEVKNNEDYICKNCEPKINIISNTFTDGCASMVLNSYASELTPVYVYGNTFSGSSATYNIIGRMITGTIKNNNFSGTGTDNPVYLQQCTPDMFGNVINGGGTTMILNGHSYPNLSPLRTDNICYWYGGQNKLYSTNAGNINVIDAGLPFINYGHNQFSKNSDPLYFHIAGALDSTVETFNAAKNAWCSSGENPVNYLYTSGNPYVITDFSDNLTCNQLPAVQYTGSVITNIGFGINDTLFTSSYTYSYIPPDELLYSQASGYMSGSQFLDAINSYKFLINNHTVSDYLNTSLYDMFDCYQNLDTSENTT